MFLRNYLELSQIGCIASVHSSSQVIDCLCHVGVWSSCWKGNLHPTVLVLRRYLLTGLLCISIHLLIHSDHLSRSVENNSYPQHCVVEEGTFHSGECLFSVVLVLLHIFYMLPRKFRFGLICLEQVLLMFDAPNITCGLMFPFKISFLKDRFMDHITKYSFHFHNCITL